MMCLADVGRIGTDSLIMLLLSTRTIVAALAAWVCDIPAALRLADAF